MPKSFDVAVVGATGVVGESMLEILAQRKFPVGEIYALASERSVGKTVEFGNRELGRGSIKSNSAYHIWDLPDANGYGAAASVAIPWFADRFARGEDWRAMAWWIHDHLPYSHLEFYPKLAAFNIQWHEQPWRRIDSFIHPRGCLTKPGMDNQDGSHASWYRDFPAMR